VIDPETVRRPIGDHAPEAALYYGADCRETLRGLPAGSVHTVVTSPPYFGLRDYGTGDAQIGLENTLQEFVDALVDVFREVRRVLRDDGTVWLNLGDSYATGPPGNKPNTTADASGLANSTANQEMRRSAQARKREYGGDIKQKDLVGAPWMVAFALRADGWYLRSDIIWAKSSCMPESIRDRPTKSHEYLFLLSKSPRYFYDTDAIREPITTAPQGRNTTEAFSDTGRPDHRKASMSYRYDGVTPGNAGGRNKRTVWTVNPKPYPGAHFAVFPPELITPCVLAGTSEHGCCPTCGSPWERVVEHGEVVSTGGSATGARADGIASVSPLGQDPEKSAYNTGAFVQREHVTKGWRPTCECDAGAPVPCTVMDPFSGSGTTGEVALDHGRAYVGLDLNTDYLDLARARLLGERPPSKTDEDDGSSILEFFS
jgi:DNA modification methylase